MFETGTVIITIAVLMGLSGIIGYAIARKLSKFHQNGDSELEQSQKLIRKIREAVLSQILNNHAELLGGIAKQKQILKQHGRNSIAIFISEKMFKELMLGVDGYKAPQVDELYEIMRDLRTPVGFMGDLPIYISELLTQAPVFVVGSFTWSFER